MCRIWRTEPDVWMILAKFLQGFSLGELWMWKFRFKLSHYFIHVSFYFHAMTAAQMKMVAVNCPEPKYSMQCVCGVTRPWLGMCMSNNQNTSFFCTHNQSITESDVILTHGLFWFETKTSKNKIKYCFKWLMSTIMHTPPPRQSCNMSI